MKPIYCLRIVLTLVIISAGLSLSAQKFDSLLNKLNSEYPQEKLYLQYDKSIYNPGETIWFKAYLLADNNLSLISKTLYAELIDEKGRVLQRKTAPIVESSAAAAFDLPAVIPGSIVYIRAYTKWMLNFDSSFLYTKAIPLAVISKKTAVKITTPPAALIQFFPEGGDMVDGISSRIAFKATDRKGIPIRATGEIVDSKGTKLASFKSVHDGMGFFVLKPSAVETYKANWKDEWGNPHQTALPAAQKNGIALELNNLDNKIEFTVKRSTDNASADSFVYIVAQTQQQFLYSGRGNLVGSANIHGFIPTDVIPSGIVQVTIFNQHKQPLAERIVFVNHEDYYFITDLNAPNKNFDKRKKNVIQIDVPDTIPCNLSISVTDQSINPGQPGDDNIFSHLLLTSDIKGYVHNPGYYFSSEADSVARYLDLVMMTNGWRRFRWEDIVAGKWPVLKSMPENYLGIVGEVYGISKNLLVNKSLTGILELKNQSREFLSIPVHPDGKFEVEGMVFYDTAKLYYQFNNDKEKVLTSRASFRMSSNLLQMKTLVIPDSSWILGLTKADSAVIMKNKQLAALYVPDKVKTLAAVVITVKQKTKKEKMEEEYTSGFFKGSDDYTFIPEDDPAAASMLSVFDYLQSRVAGLQITLGGGTPTLSWRGGTPALFLNESPSEADAIQNIPMSDVAMVKVFRPPFFGATGGGAGGAIAVYLKKGAAANQNVKGLDFTPITGYSPVKQFYSPNYEKADENIANDDVRTTLYWNPFVLTDKEHRRIQLTFFNNDITRKFRVVVEGFSDEGKLTRIEKVFQ